MTFDAYDVIVVPFPFTDRSQNKRRPALVLSDSKQFNAKGGHSLLAMITSAKNLDWPLDVSIRDLDVAGLSSQSVVRMNLFTLDHRFIEKKIGGLSARDREGVMASLKYLLPAK